MIINPTNKYNFKQHKTKKFQFFYRSPSIIEIKENKLKLPLVTPTKIILEERKYLPIKSKKFKEKQEQCDFDRLLNEENLIGKLNAIQASSLHLINKGYQDIGIFCCDLFTTSRFTNKRADYKKHCKDINLNLLRENKENDLFVLHDPFLNFIILKKYYTKKNNNKALSTTTKNT